MKGITIAAFISIDGEISTTNMNCKFQEAKILLTDELGYLTNVSRNFRKRYLKKDNDDIVELKINVSDFVPTLHTLSEEELKNGVKASIIKNRGGFDFSN